MSFVSIRAVFDGKEVRLLETAPVHKPYRVLVTFIGPDFEEAASNLERFWASFGAWKDDRSVEATYWGRGFLDTNCTNFTNWEEVFWTRILRIMRIGEEG